MKLLLFFSIYFIIIILLFFFVFGSISYLELIFYKYDIALLWCNIVIAALIYKYYIFILIYNIFEKIIILLL